MPVLAAELAADLEALGAPAESLLPPPWLTLVFYLALRCTVLGILLLGAVYLSHEKNIQAVAQCSLFVLTHHTFYLRH